MSDINNYEVEVNKNLTLLRPEVCCECSPENRGQFEMAAIFSSLPTCPPRNVALSLAVFMSWSEVKGRVGPR